MDLGLTDRTAFIAGASKGLGYAAALELAKEGCNVAVCSRNEARITDAADDLRDEADVPENRVLPLVCDVTDEAAVQDAIKKTVDTFGGLNVIVTPGGRPRAQRRTWISVTIARRWSSTS
jgi:3-oxoacyl-[acyl-carrier protein] reductase